MPMPSALIPGFITLHGNRLEDLRSAVIDWISTHPLDPLEQEIILVQSNGVAEWLKIALAQQTGVCAATRVTLPARFLWEAYRSVLGSEAIPPRSALDRAPLVWRLMRLLPQVAARPGFEPLQRFLSDQDPERRLQLARRLSDLMDLYQVYRADWLADWENGQDVVRGLKGDAPALVEDQRWQAALWRTIIGELPPSERLTGRSGVHQRFVDALQPGAALPGRLPPRVILFGISALPYQTMQALAALSGRMQVILAIPNPCQFYWGDIIEGRELFAAERRRQSLRDGKDLSAVPYEQMHSHCNPLLAAWGRQGRDFIRMLDEFDNAQATVESFSNLRLDLFSEGPGEHLLAQVQAAIRDMLPLDEHPLRPPEAEDRSIEFHVAHSPQREVEILHDALLGMLAQSPKTGLKPRDIVVMVPDIERFTPAIQSVFGQYSRSGDKRHIPFAIADVTERALDPLPAALEWLLRLPEQRCRQSEVRDLLEVPAIAARFGIDEDDLPRIGQWLDGAGVRWGLDGEHREALGLAPAGEQNAWIFGVRRMLLGYANGTDSSYADIEPYGEVGGLDAALAGSLASFVETLLGWRKLLAQPVRPYVWGTRARALLRDFFDVRDEQDRLTCVRLDQSLQTWLDDCAQAGFDEDVPLAVVREAWLGGADEGSLNQRFVSGGVTFCTLMPMRAVPFRVVCLLGMNDGDYPRRVQHADFDLLAQAGLSRPGDRSRRDDDRYLMLEALLAARDKLYISWVGRDVRDNSAQPASILVSQLQDYLRAGWDIDPAALTTEHPLQPFSRRYFDGSGMRTYAKEWRAAHTVASRQTSQDIPRWDPGTDLHIGLKGLARFIRQPAAAFFHERLGVYFSQQVEVGRDDEPFFLSKLEEYDVVRSLLDDSGELEARSGVEAMLRERAARLGRKGMLPIGHAGKQWQEAIVQLLVPVRSVWVDLRRQYPHSAPRLPVSLACGGIRLEDWIDKLHSDGEQTAWLDINPGKVLAKVKGKDVLRADKLILAWLRQLAAAAAGYSVTGYIVARDRLLVLAPLEQEHSQRTLEHLVSLWRAGMDSPLPTACRTALQLLAGGDPRTAYDGGFQGFGEVGDACLARLWPSFEALSAEPGWENCSRQLYGPLHEWVESGVADFPLDSVPMQKQEAA